MSNTRGLILDALCPVNWQHPLNRGLMASWTIPPNSGWSRGLTLRDLVRGSKKPKDGTLTNGPTWVSGPNGLGAIDFDGSDDQVPCGSASDLDPPGDKVTLLVHCYSDIWDSTQRFIAGKWLSGAPFAGYWLRHNGADQLQGLIATGGSLKTPSISVASPAGRWMTLGLIYDGSNSYCYADGAFGAGTTTTGNVDAAANPFGIGGGFGTEEFNGRIAAVDVWYRALSVNECIAWNDQIRRGRPDTFNWIRPWSFGVSTEETPTYAVVAPNLPSRGRVTDVRSPLNISHQSHRKAIADWSVLQNSGWRGGTTVRDIGRGSRRARDATITGTIKYGYGPYGSGSVRFDNTASDNYAEVTGQDTNTSGSNGFSAWALVYFEATDTGGIGDAVITHGSGSDNTWALRRTNGGNVAYNENGTDQDSGLPLPNGEWGLIGFSVIDTTGLIFCGRHSSISSSSPTVGVLSGTPNAYRLGQRTLGAANGSKMRIAEAVVYKGRALTLTDFKDIYEQVRQGNPDRYNWVDVTAGSIPPASEFDYSSTKRRRKRRRLRIF